MMFFIFLSLFAHFPSRAATCTGVVTKNAALEFLPSYNFDAIAVKVRAE